MTSDTLMPRDLFAKSLFYYRKVSATSVEPFQNASESFSRPCSLATMTNGASRPKASRLRYGGGLPDDVWPSSVDIVRSERDRLGSPGRAAGTCLALRDKNALISVQPCRGERCTSCQNSRSSSIYRPRPPALERNNTISLGQTNFRKESEVFDVSTKTPRPSGQTAGLVEMCAPPSWASQPQGSDLVRPGFLWARSCFV